MEEEYKTSSNFYPYIDIVDSIITSYIQCRDDSVIHRFDIAIKNVSIWLSKDLMLDILISNVRVRRTITVYTTYTNMWHHGISADLLVRKWDIGIYKAKCTHQYTTQYNMISAPKTITKWYRTYFCRRGYVNLISGSTWTHFLQSTSLLLIIYVPRSSHINILFKQHPWGLNKRLAWN